VATNPVLPIVRGVDETRPIDASGQSRTRRLLLLLVVAGLVALVEAAWLAVIALAVVHMARS